MLDTRYEDSAHDEEKGAIYDADSSAWPDQAHELRWLSLASPAWTRDNRSPLMFNY